MTGCPVALTSDFKSSVICLYISESSVNGSIPIIDGGTATCLMDSELRCSNSSSNDFTFDEFSNCSSVESGFCVVVLPCEIKSSIMFLNVSNEATLCISILSSASGKYLASSGLRFARYSSNNFESDGFCSSVESGFCSGLIFTITSRKHPTSLMDNPRAQTLPFNGSLDIHSLPDQIARIDSLILTQRARGLFIAVLMSKVDKRNPAFVMPNCIPFVCQVAPFICVFTQSRIVSNILFLNMQSVESGIENVVSNALWIALSDTILLPTA